MLGENSSVSTEMAHEVGGNSAEVKGQDVSVIVGVGSPTGKALITGRARRIVATRVVVGLYRLFPITVSIKGILPHKFCTVQAVCVAVTAAAAGISSLH